MALSHAPGARVLSALSCDKNPASVFNAGNFFVIDDVLRHCGHVALNYAPGALAESALAWREKSCVRATNAGYDSNF
jgi:hypothetical protein